MIIQTSKFSIKKKTSKWKILTWNDLSQPLEFLLGGKLDEYKVTTLWSQWMVPPYCCRESTDQKNRDSQH